MYFRQWFKLIRSSRKTVGKNTVANVPILYPLKKRFSRVFRRYKKGTLVRNGLNIKSSSTWKSVLKIFSKFTGEDPCRSMISIKLLSNFIEITPRHVCSPVNLLHVFRIHFLENTSGGLLLILVFIKENFMPSSNQRHSHFYLTK